MIPRTRLKSLLVACCALATSAILITGCTNGITSTNSGGNSDTTGSSFVVGTDAPMDSVTSFAVQLESINATDASGNSVSLLSGTPTVDFARFNGLQTLLDMNDIPVGTYTSVTVSMGTATIGYLNVPASGAPTIQSEAATLTTSTATVTLDKPLVITKAGAPAGLHVDFDLRKSILVDSNGQITGQVTPTFNINSVENSDAGAYIDEFDAAVVSVNTSAQSFVVQGPHGRQFTVNVNGQTEWENNEGLSDLTTSSIVTISGTLDRADATIDADDVAILSQDGFYADGQVTYVTPSTGTATSFDLYVRGLLPTTTGLTLGQIATVDLSGNEKFYIRWMHDTLPSKISSLFFNASSMMPGQHVSVGGPASGATNASDVTVKRVVLRHWGFDGTVVANSVSASGNTFQMQVNGFAGNLITQPVTVYVIGGTNWRNGYSGLSSLSGGANVRVVGLLLNLSGQPVMVAHYVDELD